MVDREQINNDIEMLANGMENAEQNAKILIAIKTQNGFVLKSSKLTEEMPLETNFT